MNADKIRGFNPAFLSVYQRLDRWGRSVADLLATLQELDHLG